MALNRDYMGRSDDHVLDWLRNFADVVHENPTSVGLTSAISTILSAKVTAFEDALIVARAEPTKGPASRLAKSLKRKDAQDYARGLVKTVKGTLTVTVEQFNALGITVPAGRSPIPAPQGAPSAQCIAINGWIADFELRPMSSEGRSHKPDGVSGVNIFSFTGENPPMDVRKWDFESDTTRAKFQVAFDPELPVGSKVWVCVQWKNPRYQTGPACLPIPLIIGGGAPQMAG